MSPPASVLDLWEAGLPRTPAARALLLLEAAGEPDVAGWTVGRRDLALLSAYCGVGAGLEAVAECPGCGLVLDVAVDPGALPQGDARTVTVSDGGYVVTARPPTVGDLAELAHDDDVASMRRQLLERCVLEASRAASAIAAADLPGDVVELVEAALDEADPAADIRLSLACPDCETTWSDTLDPVVFAWSAVENAARRLATDVHTLAEAYGWSEQQILELSPFRRHLYLSAVGP